MKDAMTIKPIETSYAGHRFRSRLEARWAVFFDTLGVEWKYEEQGYVVDGEPYLPDFFLPKEKYWVEVKGDLSEDDALKLIKAAAANGLPRQTFYNKDGWEIAPEWEPRILILQDIPEEKSHVYHTMLTFQPAVEGWGIPDGVSKMSVSLDSDADRPGRLIIQGLLGDRQIGINSLAGQLRPERFKRARLPEDVYRAARQARFEHGESGAPLSP